MAFRSFKLTLRAFSYIKQTFSPHYIHIHSIFNYFTGFWGFGLAKSAAVLAVSMSDRRNLENQAEGYGGVASARTHIRSRSPR